jgi:ketosteroid isomerase-like protein
MEKSMTSQIEIEKAAVQKAIEDCIKWPFPEKDKDRLMGSCARDSSFFIFHPDSRSTIVGWEAFRKMIDEFFMDEDLRPANTDIKDLRINLSRSGDVAWFSCLLDDMGEYKGKRWEWLDCRWTGVLEKRGGSWLITQMHFSLPTDRQADSSE